MEPVKNINIPTIKERQKRVYGNWVNNPVLEDYALRYAPRSFRNWSIFSVASAALGGIAYLADFAIGGSITISSGFSNAFWAIITGAIIIFLTGLPIAYYSSKYNVDMDLLTRGAGFGYLGSTITSLVYASFTFIFFALEGSIMAQAFKLYFGMPLSVGYAVSSLIIIPLVVFGMTLLSRLQVWTQPLWLTLMVAPFLFLIDKNPNALSAWTHFGGTAVTGSAFNPILYGTATGVALSLIAQIGEQVDYLRFMPDQTKSNSNAWWFAVLLAGPGWVFIGALKQLGGSFFTSFNALHGTPMATSNEPIQMYVNGFANMFVHHWIIIFLATFFVVLSQIKINVTNAYSGSLSWSNFFSRIAHLHPGRVVWIFFNVGISLFLMEMGVFDLLLKVLGFYSNVAIAWIGAIVADLVINKPILKLSPSYIEFKRAHLYNINPVGFGSMIIASIVSIMAFFGLFGVYMQAFSTFIALGLAFVLSPIIAIATKGKYYIARENTHYHAGTHHDTVNCTVCSYEYEKEDMAFCPFHEGPICSLCCSLDSKCGDICKTMTNSEKILIIPKKIA
ncbi:MAG: purine-cytosine permease family protein [Leptospirillum sp.]